MLTRDFDQPEFAYLAPQAAGNTWYPNRFMMPIESNEPYLSSALAMIEGLFDFLAGKGFRPEQIMLLGFSQGACLALEYAARHAKRYGGIVGLTGGLIGPDDTPRTYPGSFDSTPIFLGASDVDFHVPKERIEETATVMRQLGGDVTMRLYPNMGHTVNGDEIAFVKDMMATLLTANNPHPTTSHRTE
jgi:phospholipase/carboxylesterase/glyoxalase family protein